MGRSISCSFVVSDDELDIKMASFSRLSAGRTFAVPLLEVVVDGTAFTRRSSMLF